MSYSATVLADSPTAYWRLGESSGSTSAVDASGNGKTGTYEGSPTLGVTGLLSGDANTAITLSGSPQDVFVPSGVADIATATSALSVEAWVKTTAAASQTIFAGRSSVSGNQILRIYMSSAGLLSLQIRGNSNDSSLNNASDCTINDGVRHHIVVTRDSSKNWKFYVDGVICFTFTDAISSSISSLDWTYIGRERRLAEFFNGTVDEVATYVGTTLTPTQVATHYTAGSAEATSGASDSYSTVVLSDTPFAYWRLGETSGIRAVDSSGNGNHGARRNGAGVGDPGLLTSVTDDASTLDGTNDRIDVPTATLLATSTSSFSAEAWIKTTAAVAQGVYCGRRWTSGTSIFRLGVSSTGKALAQFRGDNSSGTVTNVTGATTINDGNPHHIAVTVDSSGNARVYVDGVLDAGPTSTGLSAGITSLDKQDIGRDRTDGTTGNFNGTIDEVALYNTTLTATRVLAHYTAGSSSGSVTITLSSSATFALASDGPTLPIVFAGPGAIVLAADPPTAVYPITVTPASLPLAADPPLIAGPTAVPSAELELTADAPTIAGPVQPVTGALRLAADNPTIVGAAKPASGTFRLKADPPTVYPLQVTPGTLNAKGDAPQVTSPVAAVSARLLLTANPPANVIPLTLGSSGVLKLLADAPTFANFSVILEDSGILRLRADPPTVTPLTEPPPPPPPPPPGSGVSIAVTV